MEQKTALLYTFTERNWTARKSDKKMAAKATADSNMTAKAARGVTTYKDLLPGVDELKAIHTHLAGVRNWFYLQTRPWNDKGSRVRLIDGHMEFMQEFAGKRAVFSQLVDDFVMAYPVLYEKARFELNDAFNEDDYPAPGEIDSKFAMNLYVEPIGKADDFRTIGGIPPDEATRLMEDVRARTMERMEAATKDTFSDLYKIVTHIATQLPRYGNKEITRFEDTLITNLTKLLDVLPAINVTNDANLNAMAEEARKTLAGHNPQTLRDDDLVRDQAAHAAAVLSKRMAAFLDS